MKEKQEVPGTAGALLRLGAAAILFTACADRLDRTWGLLTFLCLTAAAASLVVAAREAHGLAARMGGRPSRLRAYGSALLFVIATGLTTSLLELGLQTLPDTLSAKQGDGLVMPPGWARRPAEVAGARSSYWWHGKLHVHDDRGMRRSEPFPDKAGGRCRLAAFGDSLTYGYGVDAAEAWPARLQALLGESYGVEVLNLGVSGWQSGDIAGAAVGLLEGLEPDLVLYGVCLNDFLDSGEGEQNNRRRRGWEFPLPGWFKETMKTRTLLAGLVEERYDRLLMLLGLRMSFYDDVLKDFDGYQARFGRDVRALNDAVQAAGLPPVTAMVLHQFPGTEGPAAEIAAVAEQLMTGAELDVIPSRGYFEAHAGRELHVSPWEGHPGAEAHRIFAGEFFRHLDGHPALERCRRKPAEGPLP